MYPLWRERYNGFFCEMRLNVKNELLSLLSKKSNQQNEESITVNFSYADACVGVSLQAVEV